MPMTHVLEIGAENRYQISGTRFVTRLTCSLVPNFSGTDFLVWIYGTDFW